MLSRTKRRPWHSLALASLRLCRIRLHHGGQKLLLVILRDWLSGMQQNRLDGRSHRSNLLLFLQFFYNIILRYDRGNERNGCKQGGEIFHEGFLLWNET